MQKKKKKYILYKVTGVLEEGTGGTGHWIRETCVLEWLPGGQFLMGQKGDKATRRNPSGGESFQTSLGDGL